MIEIQQLNKSFQTKSGTIEALRDINLSIRDGEIFGIIGLSGAGKSTLVRCINLLERPSVGKVIIDGADMTALPQKELLKMRQSIGMIFQNFNLLAQRTVFRNVCYPLEIAGMDKEARKARVMELLELVGLADRQDAYPSQLSGGQRQRVAIARALATNPKYLLCDEATSALDPNTTRSILQLLARINKELGVTIIIITHEMSVIEQICDRVAVIDKSEIAESGTVREIFSNPKADITKMMILPQAKAITGDVKRPLLGTKLRIIFDGESAYRPVVSELVLACQIPVNIMFADTKELEGKAYGHMIIQLPEETSLADKITAYLDENHIKYEKED